MSDYIVQMKGIEKSFGNNKVLFNVDFNLKKSSIHALLGENGTGKSTLMNILGGVISSNDGHIFVDDKEISMSDTTVANDLGIAFIHQELTLINDLTIYENLFLGRELKKGIKLDTEEMCRKSTEILKRMEIDLDPKTLVRELNASYKQTVEIARALMKNVKVIIMDEPTTSLTNVEIEHVFDIMRSLKEQGVSLVFISHKLREVVEICDSYTVMRSGHVVATGDVDKTVTEHILARYMIGKDLSYDDLYRKRKIGETILKVNNLSREKEFKNINFEIKKGEIVGFTGLLGDGRSELFSTVFGCNKHYIGEISINGKQYKMNSTTKAHNLGISYVPRNRKENGIIKDLSVGKNMSISIIDKLKTLVFVNRTKERNSNESYIKSLNIKVNDINDLITSLSGGNQQKAVLARALGSDPQVVILDNPTQGVDVGAKLEIYSIIMSLAEKGVSFIVLSSEAQEVLMLCDRLYVMFNGEIRNELMREKANEEKIMVVATGGSVKEN